MDVEVYWQVEFGQMLMFYCAQAAVAEQIGFGVAEDVAVAGEVAQVVAVEDFIANAVEQSVAFMLIVLHNNHYLMFLADFINCLRCLFDSLY